MKTKGATAKDIGASGKTFHKHRHKPGAPDPKKDPDGFIRFVEDARKDDNRLKSSEVARQARDMAAVYKAKMAKLEYEEKEGSMVNKDTVERWEREFVQVVTNGLLNAPQPLSLLVANKPPAECAKVIREFNRRMLEGWKKMDTKGGAE
jgi:hypothetical protein